MKRTNLNFVIDAAAFVAFTLLTTTGVLMRYLLPPGSGHSSAIWGLDRHEWGGVHFWVSVTFFAMLALHLVLHWRWIVCVATGQPKNRSGVRVGLGMVGLATVIALAAAPLLAPVDRSSDAGGTPALSSHADEEIQVRGSMTLAQVEQATGTPASFVLEALNLPATTPPDAQLGQLRREHGFEMSEVRDALQSYQTAD